MYSDFMNTCGYLFRLFHRCALSGKNKGTAVQKKSKPLVRPKTSREQEVGQKSDISDHFVCNTLNCVTVRPVRGHLTPKMNIAFFIRNLMLNIFSSTIF